MHRLDENSMQINTNDLLTNCTCMHVYTLITRYKCTWVWEFVCLNRLAVKIRFIANLVLKYILTIMPPRATCVDYLTCDSVMQVRREANSFTHVNLSADQRIVILRANCIITSPDSIIPSHLYMYISITVRIINGLIWTGDRFCVCCECKRNLSDLNYIKQPTCMLFDCARVLLLWLYGLGCYSILYILYADLELTVNIYSYSCWKGALQNRTNSPAHDCNVRCVLDNLGDPYKRQNAQHS